MHLVCQFLVFDIDEVGIACKNVVAEFGVTATNREVDASVITNLFKEITTWCTCPAETLCEQGERCATLKARVSDKGKYPVEEPSPHI